MRYFPILRYLVISLVLLCSACGTALPTIKPYKMDVQQGNVVTSKMLLQLRPGMTKSQVRFIMGTPLIQDSFHGNRWDYVYQMREGGKITEQRRVILDFENELLKSVRGDVIPAGSDPSKPDESKAQTGTRVVQPYKKPEEKGLISKLKFWEKDEAALTKEATEKEAAAKIKTEERTRLEAEAEAEKVAVPVVAAPEEASKSILTVPLEVMPVAAAPEVATVQPEAPKAVSNTRAPVEDANRVMVERSAAHQEAIPTEPAPVAARPSIYQAESGMLFDRTLHSVPLEFESEAKPALDAPRAGNKAVPKPKELPPENEPSFFDRMLERIGF